MVHSLPKGFRKLWVPQYTLPYDALPSSLAPPAVDGPIYADPRRIQKVETAILDSSIPMVKITETQGGSTFFIRPGGLGMLYHQSSKVFWCKWQTHAGLPSSITILPRVWVHFGIQSHAGFLSSTVGAHRDAKLHPPRSIPKPILTVV